MFGYYNIVRSKKRFLVTIPSLTKKIRWLWLLLFILKFLRKLRTNFFFSTFFFLIFGIKFSKTRKYKYCIKHDLVLLSFQFLESIFFLKERKYKCGFKHDFQNYFNIFNFKNRNWRTIVQLLLNNMLYNSIQNDVNLGIIL